MTDETTTTDGAASDPNVIGALRSFSDNVLAWFKASKLGAEGEGGDISNSEVMPGDVQAESEQRFVNTTQAEAASNG